MDLLNRHEAGDATANLTRDGDAARSSGYSLEVGMFGVNERIPVPSA